MLELTLKGHGQYDGVYGLDFEKDPITKREWHWIKEIADVRPGQMAEAASAGDQDIDVAFSVIAVVRGGRAGKEQWRILHEFFLDSTGEMEARDTSVEEDDAGPPLSVTPPPSETGSDENKQSSSGVSNGTGEGPQATVPGFTGHPV